MQKLVEKIEKEAESLSQEDRLEVIDRLIHQMKDKRTGNPYNWGNIYGIGKGLWKEDAQEHIDNLREDRL